MEQVFAFICTCLTSESIFYFLCIVYVCVCFSVFLHAFHIFSVCFWMLFVTHVCCLHSSSGPNSSALNILCVCACVLERVWGRIIHFVAHANISLHKCVTQMCRAVLRNDGLLVLEVRSLPTLCNSFQQGALTFAADLEKIHACLPSICVCVCMPFML